MLIGIDASRANRPHKSGTEWYSYYLIRWLAKLDSKNKYLLYTDKPLQGGLVDLTTENSEFSGKEKVEFAKKGWQKLKSPNNNFQGKILSWLSEYYWTLGRLSLEMIFFKPDILFVPSHTLPIIYPKKSIVTIHDVGFERDRALYKNEIIGPEKKGIKKIVNWLVKIISLGKYGARTVDYLSWSTRHTVKRAKIIIVPSEFTKNEMINIYKTDGKKIRVVPNGYNNALYKKIENLEEVKNKINKYGLGSPYLLYVGRLEKKKNTPALIEAFALVKEKNKNLKHKLVLIGDASFGYDEVNYAIREFGLADDVIMPGWVKEEDMPYIYNGAEAFIFPSLYEGFGIPLIQAMASEIPILASDTTSIPEVVGDAGLFFNPNNSHDIAEKINKLLMDENLRKELINKGRERVKNYSWENCARQILEIINSL